ncbi:MAG TPA: hypothetical protein VGI39_30625 [Polyangiaceae bacterium]
MAKLAQPASSAAPASKRGQSTLKATADSSGLVDLAALMAEQPNWLDDALARAKGKANAPAAPSLIPPAWAPSSIAPTTADDDEPMGVPRRRALPVLLASVLAVGIIGGAGTFAWTKMHPRGAAPAVAATAAPFETAAPIPPPPSANAAAAIPPPPAADAVAAANAAAPAATTEAEFPDTPVTAASGKHGKHGKHHGSHAADLAAAADPAPAPAAPAAPPPVHAAKVSAPASPLAAALRAAAGPGASPAAPAAAPPPAAAPAPRAAPVGNNLPEHPSGSAVTSALTGALSGARGCLGSDADPAKATVTFGSSGSVQSVDVAGAAGQAASCIKGAFGKAHVPAFSGATYTARVTVRPR